MSEERNFQCYLQDVHNDRKPFEKGEVHNRIIQSANLSIAKDAKGNVIAGGDGEREIRSKLSQAIGRVEEKLHNTQRDPERGVRVNPVPERLAAHHNRLVDECYQQVMGPEAAAD